MYDVTDMTPMYMKTHYVCHDTTDDMTPKLVMTQIYDTIPMYVDIYHVIT